VNFSYDNFGNSDLTPRDDAELFGDYIELNAENASFAFGVGRILHPAKVQFQDFKSKTFASFSTFFTFSVNSSGNTYYGDGLAFIIVADNTPPPRNFSGGSLGLLNPVTNGNASNHVFAVEIDTFPNPQYNDPSNSHVGVDINSLNSTHWYNFCNPACYKSYFVNQGIFGVWIDYSAANEILSVVVQPYTGNASTPPPSQIVVPNFTLLDVLEDDGQMYVGFSGSTGKNFEQHYIYSWRFSTSGLPNQISPSGLPNQISPSGLPSHMSPSGLPNKISPSGLPNRKKKSPLIGIVLTCGIIFMGGAILGAFFLFNRKSRTGLHILELGSHGNQDNYELHLEEFVCGPRRFSYKELSTATKSFSPTEMLGRGGFGCVYKGVLRDTGALVAVKKIAEDSQQGGREFFAEVSIISRVRHRNLVQLQGWCCERSHLMLVYDYMPNKSLDKILYHVPETSNTIELTWDLRYNILIGVSSALTYLHEEWEQCVVHRDVKASNVMLDEELNPRLGDFGLARLIARTKNAQTTIVAGTLGYMAPELSTTGKATTKTDVFSYGALVLEVACGRRPVDFSLLDGEPILLDWVWMCYENGELFKVVDGTLGTKFNEEQMSTVLLLGLLCSHPDPNARPTMGYVRQVLTGNINLPPIPFHKPIASYSTQNGIEFMNIITSSTSNDGERSIESSSSIHSKLHKSW
jgi:serine/threonine protein kinase